MKGSSKQVLKVFELFCVIRAFEVLCYAKFRNYFKEIDANEYYFNWCKKCDLKHNVGLCLQHEN